MRGYHTDYYGHESLTLLDKSYSGFPSPSFIADAGPATLETFLSIVSKDIDRLEAARNSIIKAINSRRA